MNKYDQKNYYSVLAICVLTSIPITAGATPTATQEKSYGVTDPMPIPENERAELLKMDLTKLPEPKVDRERDKKLEAQAKGGFYSEHFTAPRPISEETFPSAGSKSSETLTDSIVAPDFYTSMN
ncbi:hypothetical protein CIG75_17495 [Tumebacillus algifaecis]|uniref:Uncharacterized protein n=1 Tax=Tumebacillus algifaecis TaxID=1214604 RepID=A0A223D4Y8_9BACL|nr:hypothetical protein [Tumebacillus algifaecis]ASS76580.1 hypothetical protein CIG75_17495 [Tumebacillus algifaecis]